MEAVFYFLDVAATVAALYWAAQNALRPPGTPTFGLFRYFESRPRKPAKGNRHAPGRPEAAAPRPGLRR